MKNKRVLMLLALTAVLSVSMTACTLEAAVTRIQVWYR